MIQQQGLENDFLLQNPPFPPPVWKFALAILQISVKSSRDILAQTQLTFKMLSQDLYEYLDACIMVETSPLRLIANLMI